MTNAYPKNTRFAVSNGFITYTSKSTRIVILIIVIINIIKKVKNCIVKTKINLAFTISFFDTGNNIVYEISFDSLYD